MKINSIIQWNIFLIKKVISKPINRNDLLGTVEKIRFRKKDFRDSRWNEENPKKTPSFPGYSRWVVKINPETDLYNRCDTSKKAQLDDRGGFPTRLRHIGNNGHFVRTREHAEGCPSYLPFESARRLDISMLRKAYVILRGPYDGICGLGCFVFRRRRASSDDAV